MKKANNRLGKLVVSLATVIALLFTAAACTKTPPPPPDGEAAPVLTVTSPAEAEITTGQTYTLAYTTADAAGGVTVVVTKDGAATADATYDAQTKTFSATAAGVYVLTVTAKNVTKTDVKTVTVTVTAPPPPAAAPQISFVDKQPSYSGGVNADITLPKATALNHSGEDITADMSVIPVISQGTAIAKNNDGTYTFRASVAGVHKISYFIEDDNGDDEEFIDVIVAPVTPETTVSTDENRISNLNTSELVYNENFQKGYDSDLAKGFNRGTVAMSISGGADAIAGNSLILDYTGLTAGTNTQVFFGAMDSYIRSGRWTIEFDVKKLAGNCPPFYVSFIFDGDNDGDNQAYEIGDGTTRIAYDYLKMFDSARTWHFRMFTFTGDGGFQYDGLRLALDNFTFTWKDAGQSVVSRTAGISVTDAMLDADGGKTLTGVDGNYSNLEGSGAPLWTRVDQLANDGLLTAEQAASLIPANGFNSDYAVRISTGQNFLSALNNLFVDPAYDYTFTVKAYAPAAAPWYFFIANGSGGQAFAQPFDGAAGAKTWTHTLQGNAAYAKVGFWRDGAADTFLGDVTVSRTAHVATNQTPGGHSVGHTWTYTASEIPGFGGNEAGTSVAKAAAPDDVAACTEEGFDVENLRYYNVAANTSMGLFYNIFEAVGTYKITLYYYVIEWSAPAQLNFDGAEFPTITGGNTAGYHKGEVTGVTGRNFVSLFTTGAAELYLAKVVVELTAIS